MTISTEVSTEVSTKVSTEISTEISAEAQVSRVEVGRDASGRPRLTVRSGPVTARVTQVSADEVEAWLLSTVATLLGGDDVRLVVVVRDGLELRLRDVAATVAYDGRGQTASWTADLRVEPGSSLVWASEPFVVSAGADVERAVVATLGEGAGLQLVETVVLGRHGERGGTVRARTRVEQEGVPLLVEDATYAGTGEDQPFVRGGARTISTRLAMGTQSLAPEDDEVVLELACGGTLARRLG